MPIQHDLHTAVALMLTAILNAKKELDFLCKATDSCRTCKNRYECVLIYECHAELRKYSERISKNGQG